MTKRQFCDLAYLRACSLPDERVFVLGLGFEDDEGEGLFVEQQEVDEAFARISRSSPPARRDPASSG
jgi:hypothetical protein